MLILRLRLVPGDTAWKADHPTELAVARLAAMIRRVLGGIGERTLATKRERIVLDADLDALGMDPGDLGLHHVGIARVKHVQRRVEGRRSADGVEGGIDHTLELSLQLLEGISIHECHGENLLFRRSARGPPMPRAPRS